MMRNWFFGLLPCRGIRCVQNGAPKRKDSLSRADDLNLHVDDPHTDALVSWGLDWQDDGPSRPHDQASPCLTFQNDNGTVSSWVSEHRDVQSRTDGLAREDLHRHHWTRHAGFRRYHRGVGKGKGTIAPGGNDIYEQVILSELCQSSDLPRDMYRCIIFRTAPLTNTFRVPAEPGIDAACGENLLDSVPVELWCRISVCGEVPKYIPAEPGPISRLDLLHSEAKNTQAQ
ncbi:hypothetical protein BS47DRAFT_199887 [Hydnum rufescens UP504]|uniref:Uncharacterized protein n=1 Tax=Hydnum rufescens UP504 TaxID=1448309 RepID=A0A9P6B7G0_9AGAM|nr:hypothetical protein BS47DRAFT_199887 [Hydnum rufescens UP504]